MSARGARRWVRVGAVLVLSIGWACYSDDGNQPGHSVPGGNPRRGRAMISAYGCGSCHNVPGVRGAHGLVGPPLDHFDRRTYIAGVLPNQLEPLMMWIMTPQRVLPGNAMPDMRVSAHDARDIAAYLYELR